MNSLGLFGISASSCNDKGCDSIFCKFRTIILLLVMDLAFMLPYNVQMSDICSCGVLPSCMWYTKHLLVFPYSYSGLVEMLSSSSPPSTLRSLGPSVDTSFLPIARLPTEPLTASRNFVVAMDILSVGAVN